MARSPQTTWELLNNAMEHYQQYIAQKEKRYELCFIDLLFISNFKGGNASITEPIVTLRQKLDKYEVQLKKIEEQYKNKTLQQLGEGELNKLIELCENLLDLTTKQETKIRGFGPSYASALLSAYFINLIPVLDRRILNGAGIEVKYDTQKQVKNIKKHYGNLIRACYKELKKRSGLSLRELDREWFTKSL